MKKSFEKKSVKKEIMLGNEAIVRGALESGIQFVSTYPGTPSSEIGNTFFHLFQSKKYKGYFEFSTNEKIAMEAAVGASFSGLKTLVAMKNFGLNVCLDPLLPFVYTGSKGPTVIIVADDPSCHSSAQSEENSRFVSLVAHIPVLEPADPQECKDFVKLAFQFSDKFKIPIIVRITTRVAHQRAPVVVSNLRDPASWQGSFKKDNKKFVTLPPRVLEMKEELLEKIEKIRELSEKSSINLTYKEKSKKDLGIIVSGVSYLHTKEALKELNLDLPILKLGFFHPLPEKKIKSFVKNLKKVLIIEELEPYLEKEVERLAKDEKPKLKIIGKDLLPQTGEIKPEQIIFALKKIQNPRLKIKKDENLGSKVKIKHLPRFCSGCPYWSVFSTIKRIAPKNTIFGGDIGCYMLAGLPPNQIQDYLLSMGSSIGIAHGISQSIDKSKKEKVITFMGDSTFFHSGTPALINAVFNKSNPLIIILDNGTTAMTGRQPHPGNYLRTDREYKFEWEGHPQSWATEEKPIMIEDVVKGCGVKNIKIVNSFNSKEVEAAIKEFLPKEEVSVIITRGICALLAKSLR